MSMENLPDELFELINRKSIRDLSTEELELVSTYMNVDEYEDYRSTLQTFQELDDDLSFKQPKIALPIKEEQSLLRKVLEFKLPVYQVAAGLLLLFMVSNVLERSFANQSASQGKSSQIENANSGKSLAEDDYPSALVFVE